MFLAALILMSAAEGALLPWLIWLIALAVTRFFIPFSLLTVFVPLIVLSAAQYFTFRTWLHPETLVAKSGVTLLMILVYCLIAFVPASLHSPLTVVGNLLLTAPLVILWFMFQPKQQRGRL